jgi:flagellar protein FliS
VSPRNLKNALQEYNQVGVHSSIEESSPHQLIQLLLDSALDKIRVARGHMLHQQIEQKGANISSAILIIEGLRASLDKNSGGQIAENLENLYSYMELRLMEANLKNDAAIMTEIVGLLGEIREAWAAIKEQVRPAPAVSEAAR